MTHLMPIGEWFQKPTSNASRQLGYGLLASSLLGISAGVVQCFMHWHLHLPGHSGFLWLAFLTAAPFTVRRHGSATAAGISGTAVLLLWSGMVPLDPAALFIYPFTGVLIDFAFGKFSNKLADSCLVSGIGGFAFTVASLVHSQWFLAHRLGVGLPVFVGYHLLFGVAGGALGSVSLQLFDYLRSRKGARAATLFAVLALVGLRRAHGAEERLGTIVVTGSTGLQHSAVGLTWVVSSSQIAASGATNLSQALELVPGVHLRLAAKGVPRVDIWGLRTRQVKLLINGVPVNSAYDGQFDPSLIPTADIKKIIVTTGDSSVLYGAGAMAGVINIITRAGTTSGWNGSLTAEGGSGSYRRGGATLAGAGSGWSSFFMIDHASRNSYPVSNGWEPTSLQNSDQRQNSALQRNTLYAHSVFNTGVFSRIGLTIRRTTAAYGIPPSAFTNTSDPFAQKPHYERIGNLADNLYQISGLYVPDSWFAMRGWAYSTNWHENDNRYDSPLYSSISNPKVKNTYLLYLATRTTGFHLQPSWKFGTDQRLRFGLDGQTSTWVDQGEIRDIRLSTGGGGGGGGGHGHGHTFGIRRLDTLRTVRHYSMMTEYSINPVHRMALVLGASENWQRRDVGPDQNIPGYDVALHYLWGKDTTWSFSAGRKIQFPTLQELYDPESGNSTLSAQRVNIYQTGLAHTWSNFVSSNATFFFLDAHGFIQKNDQTDQYQNFNHYRMDGIQLDLSMRPREDLSLVFGYTYLNARNVGTDNGGVDQLQYRPRHQLTVQATYRPLSRITFFISGHYVADQVFYSKRGPVSKAYLPDYFVANVRIGYEFSRHLSGYVGVRNLLDKNYMQSYGFPAPGRFVYVGLTGDFNL